MKRLVGAALITLAVAGFLGYQWVVTTLSTPLPLPVQGVTVEVEPGDGLGVVLNRLHERGLLPYPKLVRWWAKWQQLDTGLHVGEYRLESGLDAMALLQQFVSGSVLTYSVTLPEGITLAEAIRRLGAAEAVESVLEGPTDPRLLGLVAPAESAEGWFLPETYYYTRGSTDLAILERAHKMMRDTLAEAWSDRAAETPLQTPYEALILASIVERETSVASERDQISGVFTRRLNLGMRLQTDPTVIYGLGADYDGNLTRAHLRDTSNPWNTYAIHGLPPTPIALPGQEAIAAATQPAAGTALFFVARGDGFHAFAETLEEHTRNVKRYQLSRRDDYRSTPVKQAGPATPASQETH